MAQSGPKKVLYKTIGLNTCDDPARIEKHELAEAVNVVIGREGRISRRKGYVEVLSGSFHSGWHDPNSQSGPAYVVSGSSIYEFLPDQSIVARTTVTAGLPVNFVKAGPKVYWSNEKEKGTIHVDGTVGEWAVGEYVGPDTDKVFEDPPLGHVLGYYNGRLLVGYDRYIYPSELQAYGWFNYDECYIPFDSKPQLIVPVDGGVFVSTQTRQEFFAGEDITTAKRSIVASYPALKGFFAYEDGEMLGRYRDDMPKFQGRVAIWCSTQGICVGTQDGTYYNLTRYKIKLPAAQKVAGAVFDNRAIVTLNK